MSRRSRWPAAAACLGLGVAGVTFATSQLHGQPAVPVPPPIGEPLPPPAFAPLPPPAFAALPSPALPADVLPRDPASFRDVVKKVVPAVVSIDAKAAARKPTDPKTPGDGDLGVGSGVVIDPAGVVLTNYHVVEGADSVEVTFGDGQTYTSKDIRTDPKTDLAVIRLTAKDPLPALTLGDSDAMEVGDRVLAVGAPFGLAGSVTHGIVSAKSRRNLKLNQYEDFLQTDAAINPGNSGGPLINLAGQVIGINSAIKTRSGGFQGVGLAISSNLARDVTAQLLKDGVVRRGYVGVGVRHIDDALSARLGVAKDGGVVVTKVYDGSPAAKAGLQVGDVIAAVAGTAVKDVNTLPRVVAKLPIGQPAEMSVVRDGKLLAVTATIDLQPEDVAVKPAEAAAPGPAALGLANLGLGVADLTPELAAQFGYPRGLRGVLVAVVERSSAAADAGLARGRLVIKVDKTPVGTSREFAAAITAANPDRGALLQVLRQSGEVDFAVLRVR